MRLTTVTAWRYPSARTAVDDLGWYVDLGEDSEEVLPAGVEQSRSEPWGNTPLVLETSLHDAFESLRDVTATDDPEVAAETLAGHCRVFPPPILCAHGLPERHPLVRSCYEGPPSAAGPTRTLRVTAVERMLAGVCGVESLARHLAHQRQPAGIRLVENALEWPIFDKGFADDMLRQIPAHEGKRLPVNLARMIVTSFIDAALAKSGVRLTSQWSTHRRPELVLDANTHLGLYMVDFASRIGSITSERRVVRCVNCNQPHEPSRLPSSGVAYCTRPECQKVRKRLNQRNSRATRRAGQDV